jgi:spore coat protein A
VRPHNRQVATSGGRAVGRARRRTTYLAALAVVGLTTLASVLALSGVGPASGREVPMAAQAAPPTTATITIVGAFTPQFSPQQVPIAPGGTLTIVNPTSSPHTFTSAAIGSDGKPLFNLHLDPGQTRTLQVDLADGTYRFFCLIHSNMTGTLTVGAGGPVVELPPFEQPLTMPSRLTGKHITITMKRALVRVLPHGPRTPMWTYGGTFPGPTIVRRAGQDTQVTFVNHLPTRVGSVTIHQHGGHQASKDDGQPMDYLIRRGHSRTYDYPMRDAGKPVPAALRFYHDHRMNVTARNNWFGLQGMFLTTDPRDAKMGLPHGSFDIPLDFTDRTFRADNTLTNPFASGMSMGGDAPMGTVGDQVLVNGRFAPYKKVQPARYRLRLLNTSLFSSYDFALSTGQPFTQIGTGSGLLPHPVIRQDILLGPAQRADVVVDLRKESGRNVVLASVASSDTGGTGSRPAGLMQFRVRGTTSQVARIPDTLAHIASLKLPSKVAKTWTFGLTKTATGSFWSINGKRFNPARVDHRVRLGHVEKWRIRNTTTMTHFVHLHEEEWRTILRDGKRPPPWERGYEDVWRLDPGESVVVAAKFTDYTGDFMIHCHMLDHEDDGMMATFRVVR